MWLYGWFFVEQPIFHAADAYVLGNQKPPSCYQIIWSFQRSGIVRQNESAWAQLHCSHYILWVLSIKKLTIFNDSPVHQPLIPHNRFNLATPHVCLLLLLPLRVYPKVQASLVDVLNIMPFVAHLLRLQPDIVRTSGAPKNVDYVPGQRHSIFITPWSFVANNGHEWSTKNTDPCIFLPETGTVHLYEISERYTQWLGSLTCSRQIYQFLCRPGSWISAC